MKYNNIHPVIYLNIENISQEEAEERVKEIREYYNS
jgi:putative liporotein